MHDICFAGAWHCWLVFNFWGREKKCFHFFSSERRGVFLLWLFCMGIMKRCSSCGCHRRWFLWALVAMQLARWAGCHSSSAVSLCVPGTLCVLPLCWSASSEAEAAFLRCFFLLSLPASIWLQWTEISSPLLSTPPATPLFFSPHSGDTTLALAFAVSGWSAHLIFFLSASLHLVISFISDNYKAWRSGCGCQHYFTLTTAHQIILSWKFHKLCSHW